MAIGGGAIVSGVDQLSHSPRPAVPPGSRDHPVFPIRQPDVLAQSFGFHSWKTREPEIAEILDAHSSVIAVTSGHLHLTGMSLHGRVPQIVFAGTASYPHDVGLFTVAESTVTVEAVRLPSHLLVPETNIHGMQRHGIDFTDPDHPSYTHSVMGHVEERRFITRVRRCDSGQIGVSSRDRILWSGFHASPISPSRCQTQ